MTRIRYRRIQQSHLTRIQVFLACPDLVTDHFPRLEADFGSPTLIRIPIPFHQLEELIQRQNVEMRLGNVELAFSDDDIKKIRSFLPQRKTPNP
jgi:hypothetical protein